MLKKRLIFTLLSSNDSFMLSRNFNLQKVGNLEWIKTNYNFELISESIDELIVLNVNREEKKTLPFCKIIEELSSNCFVPFSAGGGIKRIEDAHMYFNSGADKLVLNSLFYKNKKLVEKIAYTYGNQCIVCSIDYKIEDGSINIYTSNASLKLDISLEEAIQNAFNLGAGEIYLTCINKDGTGQGLDIDNIVSVSNYTNLPIIASGGIGMPEHMVQGLSVENVDSISTANLFYFMGDGLYESRKEVIESGINLATW